MKFCLLMFGFFAVVFAKTQIPCQQVCCTDIKWFIVDGCTCGTLGDRSGSYYECDYEKPPVIGLYKGDDKFLDKPISYEDWGKMTTIRSSLTAPLHLLDQSYTLFHPNEEFDFSFVVHTDYEHEVVRFWKYFASDICYTYTGAKCSNYLGDILSAQEHCWVELSEKWKGERSCSRHAQMSRGRW